MMAGWLIGLIVLMQFGNCALGLDASEVMKKEECSETTIDGMSCKNCSSDKPNNKEQSIVFDLPHDLGTDLKCLYSMNLIMENISSKTFQNYPDLTHLHIIRAGFNLHFPKNTFEPLKKLHYLNLTDTRSWDNPSITWPSSLRILDISRFPVDSFVALSLHFLEVLNVSGTNITEFPTLSQTAPLKLIVLDNTKLTNFKIEDLAKLCKLASISMQNMDFGTDKCKCLMLKAWSEKYNVTLINERSCEVDAKCLLTFTEASLRNRNECLDQSSSRIKWYIIIAILIGILLLVMCASGFVYTWLSKKEEKEGILGITDEQLEHFTPRPQQTTNKPHEGGDEDAPTEGEGDGGAPEGE